jgi:hypothetical protein
MKVMSRRGDEVWAFFSGIALAVIVVDIVIVDDTFADVLLDALMTWLVLLNKDDVTSAGAEAVILTVALGALTAALITLLLLRIRNVDARRPKSWPADL